MTKTRPKIYVIVGPTASGKTAYSIKLAQKVGGEIISADSRQVYRGMDIGTGKVTKKEMAGIPHHLLDVASPKKVFTVSDYQKLAKQKIEEIIARGHTPIIVGGTGFYIQAIVDDLVLPEVEPNKKLRASLEAKPPSELFAILKKLDPVRAKNIDAKNPRRLIRAIEIVKALGKVPELRSRISLHEKRLLNSSAGGDRFSRSEMGSLETKYDFKIIGIKIDQEKLNKKIHQRLIERLKSGMLAEVKKLHAQGLSWKRMEELGLEYRYLARFLNPRANKKITKSEMTAQLEKEIIKYSKRQMAWFKRDKRIKWVKI
ncbi:MAG: tRNA (adenosine(37)-N6)-dimethylallyltransferase MiaA [Candidatus Paceibacterota bacterium]|jgi:tRNA dimethylallyltransferase